MNFKVRIAKLEDKRNECLRRGFNSQALKLQSEISELAKEEVEIKLIIGNIIIDINELIDAMFNEGHTCVKYFENIVLGLEKKYNVPNGVVITALESVLKSRESLPFVTK